MDKNYDKRTKYYSDVGSVHRERSSPSKHRVTFQLGSEDKDYELETKYSDAVSPNDDLRFRQSKWRKSDRFKRKVSDLMQDKETFKELKKDSKTDFESVAQHLLKKSSIYAVSQVGHAESPYRKMLWILVLTAGLLGCGYEIYRFLVLYFQYPVVINLNVENEKSLEFPGVTICNLNRMRKKYEICLERNKSSRECVTPQITATRGKVTISERRSVASCSGQLSGVQDETFNDRVAFLTKYSRMDSESRKNFGHQINDLIRNCSFNGVTCSFGYFSYFQSLRYGNCFTFNKFSAEDDTVLRTSSVGIMSGLDMTLDFDPDNYLPVTSSVGARVILHDPREDPNPEEEGVNIGPGFETTLAVKQTSISRLPAPFKDRCVVYGEDEGVRGKNRMECVRSCIQEQNYERCSCIDPTLPSFKDYKHCNMTDLSESCCLDTALDAMATEGLPCKCPLPCFSTTYDLRLSTALWPSSSNYFDCDECAEDEEAVHQLRQKQARLKIYYTTLERTVYEQKAMFQDSELFSHLGGQFGLWLGLSIVAAFELLENVIYICKYCATLSSRSTNG